MSLINDQRDIDVIVDMMQKYNQTVSSFHPGQFKDLGSLEAVISKMQYYDDYKDAILAFFISGHDIHPFHDGNKRTMQKILLTLLESMLGLAISDSKKLSDMQIWYTSREISKEHFRKCIEELIVAI